MSKSTFIEDLNIRIRDAERVIAAQNEHLVALRHLLHKETGAAAAPPPLTPAHSAEPPSHPGVNFKGRTSEIILALVQQSGEHGTRPRDVAEILLKRKLMKKGSNMVHSHLSELKARGMVKQKAEGLYVVSAKPVSVAPVAAKKAKRAGKKRKLSPEGREAISKAVKARWAAIKKAKG